MFAASRAQFAEAAGVFAGNNRQMAVWLRKVAAHTLRVALVFAADKSGPGADRARNRRRRRADR